jgi:hypothetical protein
MLALVGSIPVLQQPFGDTGHARGAGFTPCSHARADLIDQWNFYEYSRIIEGLRALRCDDVIRGPPTIDQIKAAAFAVVAPVVQ